MGEVEQDSVDGLDIVGWTSSIKRETSEFTVTVTVRNSGETTTDALSYQYFVYLYRENGEWVPIEDGTAVLGSGNTEVCPGGTIDVRLVRSVENPDTIGTYSIALYCTRNTTGTYCG